MQVAPSIYHAAKKRPRSVRDAELVKETVRVFNDNFGLYGPRKVWTQLSREDVEVPGARWSD